MFQSREVTNARRHDAFAKYRRVVWEKLEIVPFPHQADWMVAGEGFALVDRAPVAGEGSQLIQLPDGTVTTYALVPRTGGAAHVLTDLAAFKSGKALTLDTPIPTPSGWTTMGAIVIGQQVFDELGHLCTVMDASPLHIDKSGTYRITFDDGSIVECSGQHEWVASTPQDRHRHPGRIITRRTIDLLFPRNKHKQRVFGISVCEPLCLPDLDLPIPPYTLGAWLGDGHSNTGQVTKPDREFIAYIEADGYDCWRVPSSLYGWRVDGLTQQLKDEGLLHNKHVPRIYFRASISQRLALLQGLMDSDGHCGCRGRAEFMNMSEPLALAVYELAVSLGLKPAVNTKRATLNGLDYGLAYRVTWTSEYPVFRLERKARFLKPSTGGKVKLRHIESVERIDDKVVRCITVSSPSHQFLCGEACIPTHNSFSSSMFLSGFAAPDVPGGAVNVDIIGLEYDTSEPEFDYLSDFLLSEKGMNLEFDSHRKNKKEGAMWITLKDGRAHFEVKSYRASRKSDAMKGKTRDAYCFTEAYQLPGLEVYSRISQNLRQRDGFALFATTPDRAWVTILHDKGHVDPYWHCVCNTDAQCNPFTFDQAARDRDDPDKGGLMTRERFDIAWLGKVKRHIGMVYDYSKDAQMFHPLNMPHLWTQEAIQMASEAIQ